VWCPAGVSNPAPATVLGPPRTLRRHGADRRRVAGVAGVLRRVGARVGPRGRHAVLRRRVGGVLRRWVAVRGGCRWGHVAAGRRRWVALGGAHRWRSVVRARLRLAGCARSLVVHPCRLAVVRRGRLAETGTLHSRKASTLACFNGLHSSGCGRRRRRDPSSMVAVRFLSRC
jgi:hypothetical protein